MKPAAKTESGLLKRLRRHFGREPAELPVVEQSFAYYERPNLHLALEELLREPGRGTDGDRGSRRVSFRQLIQTVQGFLCMQF